MRTTRVAAVSMNGFLGEPDRVLHAIDAWCEQVAAEGVELVLFPELVIHGHCTPNTWELAEPVPDGPSVRRLEEIAASPAPGHLRRDEREGARHRLQHAGPGRAAGVHRQAAEAAPLARRGVLLQGGPRDPRLRRRPVQGRDRHLLRQPVPRGRPRAGPAGRRGPAHAARRPVQALGRRRRRARRRPAGTRTSSSRSTPCGPARTPASRCWPTRRGGRGTSISGPATARTSPTTPAPP